MRHLDSNNFGPRLGFAWTALPKTVVRGGYGISYIHFNRIGAANVLAINGPQVVNAVVSQTNPTSSTFRTTQQGYPVDFASPSKFNPLTANVTYMPNDYHSTEVQSTYVSVQRELASNIMVDVAYVHNRADGMMMVANYNQAVPNNAAASQSLQSRRPIPSFGDITYVWNATDLTMQLYVNGVLAGTSTGVSSDFGMPTGAGLLGNNAGGTEGMVGTIYRVTVYSGVLPDTQIKSHADAYAKGVLPIIKSTQRDGDQWEVSSGHECVRLSRCISIRRAIWWARLSRMTLADILASSDSKVGVPSSLQQLTRKGTITCVIFGKLCTNQEILYESKETVR